MRKNIKLTCSILAICFVANCLTAVSAYAVQVDQNQQVQSAPAKEPASTVTPQTTPAPAAPQNPADAKVSKAPATPAPDNTEKLWYSSKISMKKEHQKLLWDYCQKRNLDYTDMLALISTESNFQEKSSDGPYKGYFQVSKTNAANLAKCLKIANTPLDGAININMGTSIFSSILQNKRVKGLTGKKRRDVALSIYQRGVGGYDKRGINYRFLKAYYKRRDKISSYFK